MKKRVYQAGTSGERTHLHEKRGFRPRVGRLPLALLAAVLLLWPIGLGGCHPAPSDSAALHNPGLVWPSAPLEPRIAWEKQIGHHRDLHLEQGFWRRLRDILIGRSHHGVHRPYGVHSNGKQQLLVVDTAGRALHVMDVGSGRYTEVFGEGEAVLISPIGVTEDDQGMVYITDSARGAVLRYDTRSKSLRPFVTSGLVRPTGIVFNPLTRNLYLSDTAVHQLVVFDLMGNEVSRIGSRGHRPGEFNFPTDLCVDRQGRIIVTDALNARIQVLSADGAALKAFGQAGDGIGRFSKPKGVAVDSEGHIYVVDALLDAVQIFDPSGRLLLSFGERGQGPGQFWMPSGISIDRSDTIYVSDTYNQRVQVFRYLAGEPGSDPVR